MNQVKQASLSLAKFYRHPVATISFELLMTVFFIFFLGIAFIQPTLKTMSQLTKEIEEKTDLNKKLGAKIAALNTAQTEYYRWQDQIELLNLALPSSPNETRDLKVFEKLAVESNVVLLSVRMPSIPRNVEVGSDEKLRNLPVSISISGDYISIRDFVDKLLNSRRVYIVNSVTFSINKNKGRGKALQASLSIDMPYYQ